MKGAISRCSSTDRFLNRGYRRSDALGDMKLVRLGLASVTVLFGLLCAVPAVVAVFDYGSCRSLLSRDHGLDRIGLAAACNYDLQAGLWAAGLCLAFGITSYFLLRSRWRPRSPRATPVSN